MKPGAVPMDWFARVCAVQKCPVYITTVERLRKNEWLARNRDKFSWAELRPEGKSEEATRVWFQWNLLQTENPNDPRYPLFRIQSNIAWMGGAPNADIIQHVGNAKMGLTNGNNQQQLFEILRRDSGGAAIIQHWQKTDQKAPDMWLNSEASANDNLFLSESKWITSENMTAAWIFSVE